MGVAYFVMGNYNTPKPRKFKKFLILWCLWDISNELKSIKEIEIANFGWKIWKKKIKKMF